MNRFALVMTCLSTLLGSLSGCGTPIPTPCLGPGHTPTYVAGYNDGCSSGNASQNPVAGFYRQDVKMFDSDKQYAEGWNTGYKKCEDAQIKQLMRTIRRTHLAAVAVKRPARQASWVRAGGTAGSRAYLAHL